MVASEAFPFLPCGPQRLLVDAGSLREKEIVSIPKDAGRGMRVIRKVLLSDFYRFAYVIWLQHFLLIQVVERELRKSWFLPRRTSWLLEEAGLEVAPDAITIALQMVPTSI